jgi:uncharacterized phage protein (TIGR01671 family)
MIKKFRFWSKNKQKFVQYPSIWCGGNGELYANMDEGDDIIIQQWTGLLDKNNKEIFEGDIIKIYNYGYVLCNGKSEGEIFYTVEWKNIGFTFNIINGEHMSGCGYYTTNPILYEIIGNIFENPELLEKKT